MGIKHGEYLRRAREIEASLDGSETPLAVLSSFTVDFLKPYLTVCGADEGLPIRPWCGPFGQLEQQVLDDQSALWQARPRCIWIMLRLEDVLPRCVEDYHSWKTPEATERLAAVADRVAALARELRQRTDAPLFALNLHCPRLFAVDPFDASNPNGLGHLLAAENRRLAAALGELADAYLLDYERLVAEREGGPWTDPRLWYMARIGVAASHQAYLARAMIRASAAVLRAPAKCLVLDLDNTLWGGVLGDDGPEGIAVGDDYPGNVFKDFQATLLGYYHKGFLLAIASKNDQQLVTETLETHPEMLLKADHFSVVKASFGAKAEALQQIAAELNIGVDALVFVDDNPLERAQIRQALPSVRVVELPTDPMGYRAALLATVDLDRARFSAEDRKRSEMYQAEGLRRKFRQATQTVEQFLASLEMVAEVGLAGGQTLERIHQLIGKTNQFNLTTRRHTLEQVRAMMGSPDHRVAWLRLKDRFSDMGLVCVGIIARAADDTWEIDTLLMSCRVMGRGVEVAFLAYLAELARSEQAARLRGVYQQTRKNKPVVAFYPDHGFEPLAADQDAPSTYAKEITPDGFSWPETIRRVDATES